MHDITGTLMKVLTHTHINIVMIVKYEKLIGIQHQQNIRLLTTRGEADRSRNTTTAPAILNRNVTAIATV